MQIRFMYVKFKIRINYVYDQVYLLYYAVYIQLIKPLLINIERLGYFFLEILSITKKN